MEGIFIGREKESRKEARWQKVASHRISTSPLSQAFLTPSHRATHTSPIRIVVPYSSTLTASSGGITTVTSSARQRTNTTCLASGACTMLVPPALSSRRRSCGGKEPRKDD